RLLDRSGVFLRTQPTLEPVVLDGLPIYAVPFLDPAPLSEHLQQVAAVAPPYCVVVAHGWVAGGAASDSERDITVGGVGSIAPRRRTRRASPAAPTCRSRPPSSSTCAGPSLTKPSRCSCGRPSSRPDRCRRETALLASQRFRGVRGHRRGRPRPARRGGPVPA